MSATIPGGSAGSPGGGRPAPVRRQQVIDALCEAFARDEMALEDFERRVETAHKSESTAELDALLADLPSVGVPAPTGAAEGPFARPLEAVDRIARKLSGQPPGPGRARDFVAGIMGGSARRGRWTAARRITAIGIMGGAELDFREAALLPGVTEVHAFAFWGGVEIVVPPHVRLECSGIGIMGGFDAQDHVGPDALSANAPILRVTGVALMGGVEVRVRYPGETGREARKRIKEERRQRRELPGDRGEGDRG